MRGISASPLCISPHLKTSHCPSSFSFLLPPPQPLSTHYPFYPNRRTKIKKRFSRLRLQCSSNRQGDNESKAILDAFFLGKALAETLNERVEATVGEFLSMFGQWQAEQRKQVQDLQDEVFERAKKAKVRAAREAVGDTGLVPRSTATATLAGADATPAVPPLPLTSAEAEPTAVSPPPVNSSEGETPVLLPSAVTSNYNPADTTED